MVSTYTTIYKQQGKHRKKCRYCSKLIRDGAEVVVEKVVREKWYPVKGITAFVTWYVSHRGCSQPTAPAYHR